jgi:hypothetical protein
VRPAGDANQPDKRYQRERTDKTSRHEGTSLGETTLRWDIRAGHKPTL